VYLAAAKKRAVGAVGSRVGNALSPRFCAEQLILSQPWGANYAHHTPGFSDPPTALKSTVYNLSAKICQNVMFGFSISSFHEFFIASCFSSDLFVISFPCVIYWGVFCPIVS
jgi:hypothetical protein